ncbi:hypothetical protein SUGI_0982770 [Cryptomeria japonica]|nr:hypothetical protein SUGI_0982770 [Cryptomeria japonica]
MREILHIQAGSVVTKLEQSSGKRYAMKMGSIRQGHIEQCSWIWNQARLELEITGPRVNSLNVVHKEAENCNHLQERFHNKWNNDFVQSLETPFEGSEYREHVETLVNEVTLLLKEMQTGFDGDLIDIFRLK